MNKEVAIKLIVKMFELDEVDEAEVREIIEQIDEWGIYL